MKVAGSFLFVILLIGCIVCAELVSAADDRELSLIILTDEEARTHQIDKYIVQLYTDDMLEPCRDGKTGFEPGHSYAAATCWGFYENHWNEWYRGLSYSPADCTDEQKKSNYDYVTKDSSQWIFHTSNELAIREFIHTHMRDGGTIYSHFSDKFGELAKPLKLRRPCGQIDDYNQLRHIIFDLVITIDNERGYHLSDPSGNIFDSNYQKYIIYNEKYNSFGIRVHNPSNSVYLFPSLNHLKSYLGKFVTIPYDPTTFLESHHDYLFEVLIGDDKWRYSLVDIQNQ
jgi:hypothetical protein